MVFFLDDFHLGFKQSRQLLGVGRAFDQRRQGAANEFADVVVVPISGYLRKISLSCGLATCDSRMIKPSRRATRINS